MGDYRQSLNQFALQQLDVRVDLPNARLGIGDVEVTESVGFRVLYNKKQPTVTIPEYGSHAYEKMALDGQGNKIHPEDFPQTSFYYGNPIMEV
jgi:hypothetical protein